MMILLRLCFGALLGFLDGLRQSAFAQMKLSEFLDGFPVGFGVINEHSADHIAEAQQSLGSAADDDIVTVLQRKRKQVSAFARDWPSPIRLWMILRVNIRYHHLNHPASARARRQGPVLPDLRGKRQHIIAILALLIASQLWGQTTVNGSWWFNQGANAGIDTGTANAYVVSTPTDFKYVEPTFLCFLPANTNTGASTLTLGMLTPLTIQKSGNTALAGSEITANQPACGMYDGAGHFELLGGTSSGGSITLSANSLYGNPTGSSAAGTSISYLPPNILQNYITYKFPETAAPGAIAGNEPMDIVVDSTHNTVYICAIVAGTSAPACSAVGLSNWLQLATLPGTQTFSGTDTFSGALNFTGLTTGTQADCVGITSMGAVVLSSGACGTGGGGSTIIFENNGSSLGALGTLNVVPGFGMLTPLTDVGGVATLTPGVNTAVIPDHTQIQNNADLWCNSTTGNAAYACSLSAQALVALQAGQVFWLVADTSSATTATLTINTTTTTTLDQIDGTTAIGTTVVANQPIPVYYDGSVFRAAVPQNISGTAAKATNVAGGTTNQVVFQTGVGTTGFFGVVDNAIMITGLTGGPLEVASPAACSGGTPVSAGFTAVSGVLSNNCEASSGSTALSSVTAATGANTIASGNSGGQVWNWAQTTNSQTAFKFGETAAATGTSDLEVAIATLGGSTAIPLTVSDSLTGSQTLPALSVACTWNTTGVVDACLFANVTNTASGTASKLIDLQVGGSTEFNVDKAGNVTAQGTIATGSSPSCGTGVAGCIALGEASTAITPASGADIMQALSTSHWWQCSENNVTVHACNPGVPASSTTGQIAYFTDTTGHNLGAETAVPNTRGGTGGDSSASTGYAKVSSGTWAYAAIPYTDLPAVAFPTPATSITLAAPGGIFECTGTCTVTLPVPAAGYQFCARNANNVATVITFSAIGSSARYEATAKTSYGTAGTGTLVSGGTVLDQMCLVGKDSTHYDIYSYAGTWTAN